MSEILRLENISKDYMQGSDRIEVLKSASLTVRKSEIVSIIGSSGSGKSTLLQIAGLLDAKFGGDIYFLGKRVKILKDSEKRILRLSKIGFVYQSHHLLNDFDARENAAMPALIAGEEFDESTSRADKLLKELGLFDRRFNFPGQLSGGEQQRVAIARAMFNSPDLILADEPTGNLDKVSAKLVFDLLIEIARSNSITVILVTHDANIAKKADRCFELASGDLIEI
ncbi:MAG: ABC transporter ATP-binding protein [Rickettsiaceae bacterium]|nr:ABC transporter ATP-binding protein [Rickettsiaceae bacterium]